MKCSGFKDSPRKVIIDTDCGSDDAVAIAMALNEPKVEILFFTTVHGNVSAEQAALNTLTTIEKTGSYTPDVYIGSKEPLLRNSVYAYETHGRDGLGDLGFKPEKLQVASGNGVIKIIETLRQYPAQEIEIITLGTLTNIALAIKIAPEILQKVKRISLMGTAGLGYGNVSPVAEFNIWQDAEAASIVFAAKIPLVVIGWDACLGEAMLEEPEIEKIKRSGSLGKFAMDCNRSLIALNEKRFGRIALDMADPAAMAAILFPECIQSSGTYACWVDYTSGPSYGGVLVDRFDEFSKPRNALLIHSLKPELYKNYLHLRLKHKR